MLRGNKCGPTLIDRECRGLKNIITSFKYFYKSKPLTARSGNVGLYPLQSASLLSAFVD